MEDRACTCGVNPFDVTDQCYCAYVPIKVRKITPLPEGERVVDEEVSPDDEIIIEDEMTLTAWLASMDLLTPG